MHLPWKPLNAMLVIAAGLCAFAQDAVADSVPTGLPPSPTFNITKFSQPMPRFDVLPRNAVSTLVPAPTAQSNQTQQPVDPALGGGSGPIEGRPPGPIWAHQEFTRFPPQIAVEVSQEGAKVNNTYNPGVPPSLNSNINPALPFHPRFHPGLPDQGPLAMWTFNGTLPPKLVIGRYAEPILFREHNNLPADKNQNGGFGLHSISTHEHNGHHGAENDGFTGAYFFPNQFYDYHWPIVLAGWRSINTGATDPKAATPNDTGGKTNVAGDWHETMSTHWFHDHMFSFTSQNVYKGMAGMFNIYSALDRGNEAINDGVNLRLPSGTSKSFANLDYDVNIMLADKAWDAAGQLAFNIFDFDGFLGDRMTVNLVDNPFFEVEARKYRFRILNGSNARAYQLSLSTGEPLTVIATEAGLLASPVETADLFIMPAERYNFVVDFSKHPIGTRVVLRNSFAPDPFGDPVDPQRTSQIMRFDVVDDAPDPSSVPADLNVLPVLRPSDSVRTRTWRFERNGGAWTINGLTFGPDRFDAFPKLGTTEIWEFVNKSGGWIHPIHPHLVNFLMLDRNGQPPKPYERGQKDVTFLGPNETVRVIMKFEHFTGRYVFHCHNLEHEDHDMMTQFLVEP